MSLFKSKKPQPNTKSPTAHPTVASPQTTKPAPNSSPAPDSAKAPVLPKHKPGSIFSRLLSKKKSNGLPKSNKNPKLELFSAGLTSVKDVIAPSAIEIDFDHIKINNTYFRTLFVAGYPRFVSANWLAPLINFDHTLNISMFIYPSEGRSILDDLKRKIGEMEAEIQSDLQRGRIPNPATKVALADARSLQEQLVKGAERFYQFGLYITIPADTLEQLNTISQQVESTLGSLLIISKHTTLQMEDGFKTTLPTCQDHLMITRNMDTTSLATTFPFTSSELSANEGIMYGINEHNDSLIIFDRFSMENANLVVFGTSGSGKSYLVKLEALRYLMMDSEIIIIDPENEYKNLCDTIGGEYIDLSIASGVKINPFDLSVFADENENEIALKILSLHSLFKIIIPNLTPSQEALLDKAIILTYKQKGITVNPKTHHNQPPLMEDLYKTLISFEEKDGQIIANSLEKFVIGSFKKLFNNQSNVSLKNTFTVFGIKNLEEELRPIAMYIALDYIWTKIKSKLKKRLLLVDEAWILMRHPDSASFLYSIAKRARKYYLGLSCISQDIEDFLNSEYGKAIVTNAAIQILMKQSATAIDKVTKTFYLSQGEKHLLLSADVGEGLFFAGNNHVAIRVIASPEEHQLITTKPKEVIQIQKEKQTQAEDLINQNPTPLI